MKRILLFFQIFFTCFLFAQEGISYNTVENISYYDQPVNVYQETQCVIDVYYPESSTAQPVIVWFHGGGLTGGGKEIPTYLKKKGFVVVGVGYRLSPNVPVEDIIQDAARAVSYVRDNIRQFNGDPEKIFISGHSAGGYLALMIGLNERYLRKYNMEANSLAGVIPFSGQAITHFTARKEKGFAEKQPTIDELAPLFWVRQDAPPIILLTGDRNKEMLGRYEENAYLKRMLDVVGHEKTTLIEFEGYGHDMTYPGFPILADRINKILND